MNNDNLKNINDRPDAKDMQRKGGKASGKARREKKALRERLAALIGSDALTADAMDALKAVGQETGDYYDAIAAALIAGAVKGSPQHIKLVSDLMGDTGEERRADNKDAREERLLAMKEQQFKTTGLLDGAAVPPTVITVHKDGSLDIHGGLENAPILVDNMEFME